MNSSPESPASSRKEEGKEVGSAAAADSIGGDGGGGEGPAPTKLLGNWINKWGKNNIYCCITWHFGETRV